MPELELAKARRTTTPKTTVVLLHFIQLIKIMKDAFADCTLLKFTQLIEYALHYLKKKKTLKF